MNFYAILGVPIDADPEAIRRAYRILARRYHPDKGAGSSSEKFRQIAEAYDTLIDPRRRQGYDLSLTEPSIPRRVVRYPKTACAEPMRRESPEVFGRFTSFSYGVSSYPIADAAVDELFRDLIPLLQDEPFCRRR